MSVQLLYNKKYAPVLSTIPFALKAYRSNEKSNIRSIFKQTSILPLRRGKVVIIDLLTSLIISLKAYLLKVSIT